MAARIFPTDDAYLLNQCTKHLSRATPAPTPGDETESARYRSQIAEAWRFPIIGSMSDFAHGGDGHGDASNLVTFVYKTVPGDRNEVRVRGSFLALTESLPLSVVRFEREDTGYRALTAVLPKGELHIYKFLTCGRCFPDPINPQQQRMEDGRVWSRFFTDGYLQPIILSLRELQLLYRLLQQILPLRTAAADHFLERYTFGIDMDAASKEPAQAQRFAESVREVDVIDKLLAREEHHRLADYKLCLRQIDRILSQRHPAMNPYDMPAESYVNLYNAMAAGKPSDCSIPDWDYGIYENPGLFLRLLRRHALSIALSHTQPAQDLVDSGRSIASVRTRCAAPVSKAVRKVVETRKIRQNALTQFALAADCVVPAS